MTYIPHSLRPDRALVVALVNNTSDRALALTEAQFMRLVRSANHDFEIRPRFFTCPEISRSVQPRTASGDPYRDIRELFASRADALIITGMEPQATRVEEEPVWRSLTELLEWAEYHGTPTICSCLAAHAAVLHLDGIHRTRHSGKLSDIFDCELVTTNHPLTLGLPSRWSFPHSRYYGIPETALVANGYRIISRSALAGVDVFAKDLGAQFLFFQGHPEYDPDTLLREYKRDVRRFLMGERDEYPIAPLRYFDPQTISTLAELRYEAIEGGRDLRLLNRVGDLIRGVASPAPWDTVASQIYVNWLCAIVQPNDLSRGTNPSEFDATIVQGWQDPIETGQVLGK
jgi:homoserine O-succinyltransferase/O-acetyltransferase